MFPSSSIFEMAGGSLPAGWRVGRIDELATLNPEQISKEYTHSRIEYLDISNVGTGSIGKATSLSLDEAPSRARRVVRNLDTIVSTVRPGNRAFAFLQGIPANLVCSTGFAVLRAKDGIADPEFLFFLVTNDLIIDHLATIAEEMTAYPSVNPGDIAGCVVPIPPLSAQREIVSVLTPLNDEIQNLGGRDLNEGLTRTLNYLVGRLVGGVWTARQGRRWLESTRVFVGGIDRKIGLNRRMNQTLDDCVRSIFNFWFVEFGPVVAKMDGRWEAGEGLPGTPADTRDLWPKEFENSELGRIPKGWGVVDLGDVVAEIETGRRPSGGVAGIAVGVPSIGAESVVGLGVFDFSKTKFVPREYFDKMGRGRLKNLDILLYKDGGRPGAFEPHVTLVGAGFPFAEACINEHVYRIQAKPRLSQFFLYEWLSSPTCKEEMRVRGTGVAIPGLNSTEARALKVLVPPVPLVERFTGIVEPFFVRLLSNCSESRNLALIRDTYLPSLLSNPTSLTGLS
jgi:restriction endonuclease S subunit